MLRIENAKLSYSNKPPLFSSLSLSFQSGSLYHLQGRSGVGKTTFLRALADLLNLNSGHILLEGVGLESLKPIEIKRRILYLSSDPWLIEGTVFTNLILPFQFQSRKGDPPPSEEKLRKLMDEFNLSEVTLEDSPKRLSHGQKQCLSLLRGVLLEPKVLLVDELLSGVDIETQEKILTFLITWVREKRNLVILTKHGSLPLSFHSYQEVKLRGDE